ncbi:hypothetical protein FPQ18DRAFT_391331 [Pyronema domesticum]|uniref:Similar to mitochondrion biogenesis protein [Trichophyton tonsurans CBS 112818] acc. no. EGD96786 n=1 Tax=Pyronema omphalodes (strain CBS 100304) TaxID=1076935 RepID=U4L059_PYROM|nr:hypothetical protein FPQ18DRAFT_391331 [Pyronema domesticum]CCX07549.1 Similar to mitochondrion biogenesis protein [Trichophyton tonsurans CBS 112818]; acc. no. EGD96786 [Pyronema omphalodes CBS 100304]
MLCEFGGSWSGLMDQDGVSAESRGGPTTPDAFSRNVADEQARLCSIKWSLQLLAQAFLMVMAGSVA